ncbi:MAG: HlyC/CorC family transporter [Clostridia bacterium]|nr:HlyC/CorC family transporter [Clostridia bacterium]
MDADGNIQGLVYRVLTEGSDAIKESGSGSSGGIALLVLLFVLFVVGGGYFGGAESAFSAMNKIRIKSKADNGDKKAKNAMHISNNFEKALTTLLIGNNITHIAAASVATLIFTRLFGMSGAKQWICTAVTTFIVFLFSEMIPKSFANDRSETVALMFAGSLRFLMKLLYPFAVFFEWISNIFMKIVSKFVKHEAQPSITEEELYEIIDTIEEEGVVNEEQGDLMKSALDFSGISARDVMTMRDDIVSVDASLPNDELLKLIRESVHTRLPVYEGSLDNILGVIQIRTFIKAYLKNPKVDIRTLVMPAYKVSPDAMIEDLLTEMRQHKFYLGVVAEEGKTLGLVTIEDFLEELVGEIWDEDDVVDNDFVKLGGNRTQVNTHLKMGEIYKRLGLNLRRGLDYDRPLLSVVIEHFGRIPEEEESFIYRNMEITVETVENNFIKNVVIRLLSPAEIAELSGKTEAPANV